MKHVDIFTDGAARGNPGNGGYGALLRFVDRKGNAHQAEFSEGFELTTNNRMELLGVITALEALKEPCEVNVFTDSKYIVDAFNQNWVGSWIAKGWKNSKKEPVANIDLWKRLLAAKEPHQVSFTWVKGHAGHPENERCDELATNAADGEDLKTDEGYISQSAHL